MWHLFNNGSSIGTKGSENGTIIKDEEHELGAQITLEKDVICGIPFAITCGIYGLMMHTVFCAYGEQYMKYESIKQDIETILKEMNNDNISNLIEEFVGKYQS